MSQPSTPALVYTTNFCGFCVRAKNLLERRGVPYTEINIATDDAARIELVGRTGLRTLPQIFIGETFVGGSDELAALDRSGGLMPLVEAASGD
jgi:glutaredoxin 3